MRLGLLFGVLLAFCSGYGGISSAWLQAGSSADNSRAEISQSNGAVDVINVVGSDSSFSFANRSFLYQKITGDFAIEFNVDPECFEGNPEHALHIALMISSSPTNTAAATVIFGLKNDFSVEYIERRSAGGPVLSYPSVRKPGLPHSIRLRRRADRIYTSFACGDNNQIAIDFFDSIVDFGEDLYAGLVVLHHGKKGRYDYQIKNLALRALQSGELDNLDFTASLPAIWRADDCSLNNGEAVNKWKSADGKYTAVATGSEKERAPVFVSADDSGISAVKFNGVDQILKVEGPQPVDYSSENTIICVFKTDKKSADDSGISKSYMDFRQCAYLISSDYSGFDRTCNDFTLAVNGDGHIVAGLARNHIHPVSVRLSKVRVDDGNPHLAIFRMDAANRVLRVDVDGIGVVSEPLLWRRRFAYPITFGGDLRNTPHTYFNGSISEIIIYNHRCLTDTECAQIGSVLCERYGIKNHAGSSRPDRSEWPEYIAAAVQTGLPVITIQPRDIQVHFGEDALLHAFVENDDGLKYQWFENGELLPGMVTSKLRISTGFVKFFARKYRCRISNDKGTLFTREALLEVDYGRK